MGSDAVKVLLIEDDASSGSAIVEVLATESNPEYDVRQVERLSTALQEIKKGGLGLILLDLSLPDSSGLETLIQVRSKAPQLPIVVLTGLADEALGIKAVQEGAQDYLVKGQFSIPLLSRSLRYALERKRFEDALRRQSELYQSERKRELVRAERHEAARKMLQVLMHEIYNPLTGIVGNLSLLESEQVSPQVKECLKDIDECARKIQFALNQLKRLDLAEPVPLTETGPARTETGPAE